MADAQTLSRDGPPAGRAGSGRAGYMFDIVLLILLLL